MEQHTINCIITKTKNNMNELIKTDALLKEIIADRERAKKELEHQIEEITRLVTI